MKHLVLIQYKFNSNSKEIVYAVETFKKYAQFDYDMYLLGDKCPWLDLPVIEGDHTDFYKYACREQHIRVARDLWNACNIFKDQYDEFCLMSDDFFCLNNFTWEDICIPKYNGKQINTVNPYSPRVWAYAKWKTGQFLRKRKLPTVDFTTHCFAVYNIEKIMQIIQAYNLTEPCNDYTIEDLYGNTFWTEAEDIANWRFRIARIAVPVGCIKQAKEQGLKWLNFSENVELNKLLDAIQRYCLDVPDTIPDSSNILDNKSIVDEEKTSPVTKSYNGEKGIISLTSWKARINTAHITIENIFEKCPDWHVVLVLSEDEFPKKENELPDTVTSLPIEILWVKRNYKAFKKVAFTLKKYPNVPICTSDDDAFYHTDYATELYNKWLELGKPKCCINYVDRPEITFLGPCMFYYGVDFPVEHLTDYEIEHSNDDPWMYNYAKKHKIPIYTLGYKHAPYSLHDDNEPLHPKFKSEFMQSIQHVDS